MKLYFENSRGERRVIAEPKDRNEAWKEISKFCKDAGFKVYYVNSYETPDGFIRYDVGSWSEFFYLDIKNEHNI